MKRQATFIAINGMCLLLLLVNELTGPEDWLFVLFLVLAVWLVFVSFTKAWPTLLLTFSLLAATALPLVFAIYFDESVVLMGPVRSMFHTDQNLRIALLVVAAQVTCLLSFPLLLRNDGRGLTDRFPLPVVGPTQLRRFRWASAILLVALSVLANPSQLVFVGIYGSEDFFGETVLIGGWSLIFVIYFSYYAVVTQFQRYTDYLLSLGLVGYWLAHGNRSEVLGIVVIVALALLAGAVRRRHGVVSFERLRIGASTITWPNLLKALFALIIGVTVFQVVGNVRSLEVDDIREASVADLLGGSERTDIAVAISTVGPAVYALTASVGLIEDDVIEYQYGRTYVDYLLRTFPSNWPLPFDRPDDIALLLMREAQTLGGVHFGGEAYINFGIYGAYFFAFLYGLFLSWVFVRSRHSVLFATLNATLLMLAPRIVWYGNIYLYKTLVLILLIALAL
jgi:hypothetical protein